MTDSEAVSETNTDCSMEAEVEPERERASATAGPAAEKISTVCNEIKQRFQDPLNTDDENVI